MRRNIFSIFKAEPKFSTTQELGVFGEQLALEYLKKQGYRIVVTNYLTPLGRSRNGRPLTGEIDIIAYNEKTELSFIEVKTRSREDFATPQAAVDLSKQRKIIKTARVYRRVLQLTEEPYRYDVVSVLARPGLAPEINLLRGYFNETRFRKSSWWSK